MLNKNGKNDGNKYYYDPAYFVGNNYIVSNNDSIKILNNPNYDTTRYKKYNGVKIAPTDDSVVIIKK